MSDNKVIFLDFNGTIDFFEPVAEVKPAKKAKAKKTYNPKVVPITGDADEYGDVYDAGILGVFEEKLFGKGFYKNEATQFLEYGPNKKSIKFLKELCDKTGAKIVYSTTRRYEGIESCERFVGLGKDYSLGGEYGVTPELSFFEDAPKTKKSKGFKTIDPYSKSRQREIQKWFEEYEGPPITGYVILDDDPMTEVETHRHWIPSIYDNGFLEEEYKQALEILMNVPVLPFTDQEVPTVKSRDVIQADHQTIIREF